MASTSSPLWDEWFDTQYDLCDAIDRVIKERSEGKGDGLRLALYSAVVEHCAESMRRFVPDLSLAAPSTDEQRGKK